jgi:hypothetical protein
MSFEKAGQTVSAKVILRCKTIYRQETIQQNHLDEELFGFQKYFKALIISFAFLIIGLRRTIADFTNRCKNFMLR